MRRIHVHIVFALAVFAAMTAILVDGPTSWRAVACVVLTSIAFLWGSTANRP